MPKLSFFVALAAVLFATSGCKDSTLEPERFGSIEGQVLDFETSQPISGASVTTSPPTSALVTDTDGAFTISDALVGNYTITANRAGYTPNTVTVSVQADRMTSAIVFLDVEDEGPVDTTSADLVVDVINFTNVVATGAAGDSVTVRVQYRVRNTGSVDIDAYEAYFQISTTGPTFYVERQGQDLGIGQSDIADFEIYTFGDTATDVIVDDVSFTGQGLIRKPLSNFSSPR